MTGHLRFDEASLIPGQKTKRYVVVSMHDNTKLGVIKWHGPWRQYIFVTSNFACNWSKDCLRDLADFIQKLMDERKEINNGNG